MKTREDVVRRLTTRHLLLTCEGTLVEPAGAMLDGLTDTQRALLGAGSLSRAGVGKDIDRLARELRLGAPEPASDKGHYRFYPKGVLVRRLLQDWLENYVVDATGGVEIQTPVLFRFQENGNPLHDLAGSFHQLLYHVTDGIDQRSRSILRYGGDPGFFSLLRDVDLGGIELPFHVYELASSFRRHKTGEVSSMLRARSMTFYDHHALCLDAAQAHDEFLRMLLAQQRFLESTGRHYDLQLTVVEDRLPELLPLLTKAVGELGVPAYLTVLSDAKHYYSVVTNFCDPHGLRTLQIQLDHDNAARFGVAGGPGRPPELCVLHMSSGALERWLVSFLHDGIGRPRTASLPLWLAPTQVRVVPHTAAQTELAWQVRDELERRGVRADVDDRSRSLRQRLAGAEREWVPWVAVVGRHEAQTGTLDVLNRPLAGRARMTAAELATKITTATAGYPTRGMVERSVSARPAYR